MSRFSTSRALSLLALPLLALSLPLLGAGPAGTPVASAVSAIPSAVSPGASPAVSATLEQCVTAAGPAGRSTTFSGQMETVPGTRRMAVQIVVQERGPGESAFRTLGAPGLDAWQRSEVGLKIYKDVRQVTDLPAPASFRAVVHFRWLDEGGDVIRRATRRTSVCRQPAPATTAPTTTPPAATTPAKSAPATTPPATTSSSGQSG
jgi:hypothetical protein